MAIVIEICWIILDITKKITKKIKMLKLLKEHLKNYLNKTKYIWLHDKEI